MTTATLSPFGRWAVRQNLAQVETDGIGPVVGTLLNNGYPHWAAAVVEAIYGPDNRRTTDG